LHEYQAYHALSLAAISVPSDLAAHGVGASLLGLSDALMTQTPPGEREAHTCNLVMGLVGWAAIVFSFSTHSAYGNGAGGGLSLD
jgi:methyl coenzyme M reductase beta subunit